MKRLLFLLIFAASVLQAHENTYQFRGKHSLASYRECDVETLDDHEALREIFLTAVELAGAHVISYTDHAFEGGGYTLVVLLAESHATLHTYPEHKSCFVDLFICGDQCDAKTFHQELSRYLNPALFNQNLIDRN